MPWSVDEITIPVMPTRIVNSNPAKVEEFNVDGEQSVAIGKGQGLRSMTVTGVLYEAGSAKQDLDEDYVAPLYGLRGTVVEISGLGDRNSGDWILEDFTWEEIAEGPVAKIAYTLKFKSGSDNVII